MGFILVYGLTAWAQVVQEDAIAAGNPSDSYYQDDAYIVAHYVPPKVIFYYPPISVRSSCVEAAKFITGHTGVSWGAAGNIKPNIDRPVIGGFGLTTEGPGHMFVIENIIDNTVITFECNYRPGECDHRILNINDRRIRGWVLPSGPTI